MSSLLKRPHMTASSFPTIFSLLLHFSHPFEKLFSISTLTNGAVLAIYPFPIVGTGGGSFYCPPGLDLIHSVFIHEIRSIATLPILPNDVLSFSTILSVFGSELDFNVALLSLSLPARNCCKRTAR